MVDIRVHCPCGNEMVMSEFAVGMRTTCPACGSPLTVSWQNSRPLDSDEQPVASASTPDARVEAFASDDTEEVVFQPQEPSSRAGKHHCARCGRPFRGDWDRYQSPEGIVCNICANLVREADASKLSAGYVRPIDTVRLEHDEEPVPLPTVEPDEEELSWLERHWPSEETMSKVALYSGIAVIVIAALVFIFSGFEGPEPASTTGAEEVATTTQPTVTGVAYWAILGFTRFFGAFLGLYLFLAWGNRLPNEDVRLNLIALAPVALGVMLLSMIPFGGWIFVLILVFTMYGFEWGDLLRFPISGLVAGIFEWFLWVTLMGILGILAT